MYTDTGTPGLLLPFDVLEAVLQLIHNKILADETPLGRPRAWLGEPWWLRDVKNAYQILMADFNG